MTNDAAGGHVDEQGVGVADKPYGWYDDPAVSDRFRWWDGAGWTSWVTSQRNAPPPPAPDRRITPVPTTVDQLVRWGGLAALVGVVVFALVAGIGMVLNRRDARTQAPTPPSEVITTTPAPNSIQYHSGILVMDGFLSVPMPDGDFDPAEADRRRDGLFATKYVSYLPGSEVPASAPGAQLLVGLAADGLMHPQYRGTNAGLAATQVAYTVFDAVEPLVDQPEVAELQVDGHPAWQATVAITYQDGEVQHRAEVSTLVIQLDDWTWLIWAAATTEKVTEDQRRQLEASRQGITFA